MVSSSQLPFSYTNPSTQHSHGIPAEKFDQIHELFVDLVSQMGMPLVVVNDGEVTALAGSMSLEDNRVLGIAMGSSQAAGYVNAEGNITDWLNELAFAPVDLNPIAPMDEWVGTCCFVGGQKLARLMRQTADGIILLFPQTREYETIKKPAHSQTGRFGTQL